MKHLTRPLYYDICCYRTSMATVLCSYGAPDPALVLGAGAHSHARFDGEVLRFGVQYIDRLTTMCRQSGYACTVVPTLEPQAWEWVCAQLERGVPVLANIDAYYLSYYWIDYHRFHNWHMFVMWEYDAANQSVYVTDSLDSMRFEGWIPLSEIRLAWESSVRAGSWIVIEPAAASTALSRKTLITEMKDSARCLVSDKEDLSGAELARHIIKNLDRYLSVAGASRGIAGSPEWKEATYFQRGIKCTYCTLYWYARFIERLSTDFKDQELNRFSAEVYELAQSWRIARGLYAKYGCTEGDRREALGVHLANRLTQLEQAARRCSQELVSYSEYLLDKLQGEECELSG